MDGTEYQLVGRVEKNSLEEVRVHLVRWRGHPYADVRLWYQEEETGEWKPTKKGLRFAADLVSGLERVLADLRVAAEDEDTTPVPRWGQTESTE